MWCTYLKYWIDKEKLNKDHRVLSGGLDAEAVSLPKVVGSSTIDL